MRLFNEQAKESIPRDVYLPYLPDHSTDAEDSTTIPLSDWIECLKIISVENIRHPDKDSSPLNFRPRMDLMDEKKVNPFHLSPIHNESCFITSDLYIDGHVSKAHEHDYRGRKSDPLSKHRS